MYDKIYKILLSFRCYGNRQSLAARQRERLAMCFESFEELAKLRNEVQVSSQKKSPVGNFENIQWDKQALLEEVDDYTNGTVINWSELHGTTIRSEKQERGIGKERWTNCSRIHQVPRCGCFKI